MLLTDTVTQSDPGSSHSQTVQSDLHLPDHRIATVTVSDQDRHSVTHAEDTVRSPPRGVATDDGGYTLVQRSKRKRKAIVGSKAVPSDVNVNHQFI